MAACDCLGRSGGNEAVLLFSGQVGGPRLFDTHDVWLARGGGGLNETVVDGEARRLSGRL